MPSQADPRPPGGLKAGQRLHCPQCGSEVEVVQPCACDPPSLVLRCCGRDMEPTIGQDVHVGVE